MERVAERDRGAGALERTLFDGGDLAAAEWRLVALEPGPAAVLARISDADEDFIPAPAARKGLERVAAGIRDAVSVEASRGTPFLLAPVLLGVGAMVYFLLPFEPTAWPLAAALPAFAFAAALLGGRAWARRGSLAVLLVLAGLLAAKAETWLAGTKMLGAEITTRLTGEVVRIEHLANGRARLTIDVTGTARPALRYAPDRIRATARDLPQGVVAGSTVEGVVRLFPPSGPIRPQSYDFAFESYFDGRGATGFFLRGPDTRPDDGRRSVVDRAWISVEQFRGRLAARIRARIGGPEGEIAAALIAGVRGGIPEDANEALRITGLAHILSISGLHMALVAATVMVSLRAGFAVFPGFASRRPIKKYAAGLALLVAALYLFVSGAEVAAQRSFIMLAIMLVALLFDQAAITMRNLAISAVLILLVSPHEIMGPSFQMSFAATGALIAGYAAWSQWKTTRERSSTPMQSGFSRHARTAARYGLGLAATSLIAGLATTLYGVWHFQRVSPLSLAANLTAMPIVSVLVMPFAVIAMVAMPLGLDGPFLWVMGKGLGWMLAVARWFAERTPLDAVGQIPAAAVGLLTLALLIVTLSTTRLRLAALPFAAAGLALLAMRELPAVYVSEDARLVAVRLDGGALAVNRARPNRFTVENWQRAAKATRIVPPHEEAERGRGFRCAGELCLIETGVVVVAHAATAKAMERACASGAAVIVVADATAKPICKVENQAGKPLVVTASDLARRGGAEIGFRQAAGRIAPEIVFAIAEPFRPWHAHRAFSREARGLAPWRPEKPATGAPQQQPVSSGE